MISSPKIGILAEMLAAEVVGVAALSAPVILAGTWPPPPALVANVFSIFSIVFAVGQVVGIALTLHWRRRLESERNRCE